MSTVDLFQIGASGTRAYQAAMGAIADNIANATTDGYSRRSVQLKENAASTATGIYQKSGFSFGGVDIASVTRADDAYLDSAARKTTTALGSAGQRTVWMTDIQTALNDTTLGVGQRMSNMFSTIEKAAANPTDTTLRTDILFSMEQVNTAFQQTRGDLTTIRDGIGTAASNEVAALNDAIHQLATANEGLRKATTGSATAAQLMDSRDQALNEIAKRVNVNVSIDSKGIANVDYNGTAVVDNITPYDFAVTPAADGTLNFTLNGAAVVNPTSGTLGGLAQSASTTKDTIDKIDTLAQQYVNDVNGWHQAGYTPAGNPGQPILAYGTDAGTLSVLISDPTQIASASADGTINGNLVAATSIRGTGSMEDKWTQIISDQGNLASATTAENTAAANRDTQAQQARGDVSGVNLDREAADLLRLQQAYQGSARVIQVARELVNTILQIN